MEESQVELKSTDMGKIQEHTQVVKEYQDMEVVINMKKPMVREESTMYSETHT